MIDTTDTLDFPKEWLEPIIYQLALRLCVAKDERFQKLALMAEGMLNNLKMADQDFGNIQFTPGRGDLGGWG